MQLTNVLTFFTLTGYATAECYKTGFDWYDKNSALNIAYAACHLTLSGTYGPESSFSGQRVSCANSGQGAKVDMIIKHIKGGNRDLGPGECFDGLRKQIEDCGKGGKSTYENWEYKADPNEGNCN
ncbi:hypothetical protein B0T25DRAFT_603195 [Lasiosphaeria hispida]|uniref:Uncharacterized protein n=1 Tax=Lasiosphaeria hispida TaxID=260671 RepID=A0AAJ0MFF1_9PEZI|nr:hypothetical protein B0T25DRAFT_603195 [Lasiosphaeria hispida]